MYNIELGSPITATSVHSAIKDHWKRVLDVADVHFSPETEFTSYGDKREPGELEYSSSYGRWEGLKNSDVEPNSWIIPRYCSYSDYSGSMVEASNVKAIRESFPDWFIDGVDYLEVYGGYGAKALALRVSSLMFCESLIEELEALQDYPIADESLMSEMELEAQNEAWESDYRREFIRALEKRLYARTEPYLSIVDQLEVEKGIDLMLSDQSFVDGLAWKLQSLGSSDGWRNEQGTDMYLDVEELLKEMDVPDYTWMYNREDYSAKQRADIRRELMKRYQSSTPRQLVRKAHKRKKRNKGYVDPTPRVHSQEFLERFGTL